MGRVEGGPLPCHDRTTFLAALAPRLQHLGRDPKTDSLSGGICVSISIMASHSTEGTAGDNSIPSASLNQDSDSMPQTTVHVRLSPNMLPADENIIFKESSFFQRHGADARLPSPAVVRAQPPNRSSSMSRRARFPELGLVVKYGLEITIAEGQCTLALIN